jgi:hypothetical protein
MVDTFLHIVGLYIYWPVKNNDVGKNKNNLLHYLIRTRIIILPRKKVISIMATLTYYVCCWSFGRVLHVCTYVVCRYSTLAECVP